jgi:hypothetical protein
MKNGDNESNDRKEPLSNTISGEGSQIIRTNR